MVEYVCGFAFGGKNNDVVLIRKNKPTRQKGKLNGVGGHIEQGEEPHTAMVREFEEETGLHVPFWEHYLTLEGSDWRVYFFRAFEVDVYKVQTKTEEPVSVYLSGELPPDALPNIRWLVPLALDQEPAVPNLIRYSY